VVWIIFYTKWDLVGLYLFHCFLLIALLTWSLVSYDRQQVPMRSIGTTFGLAMIPVIIWPGLLLVSWGADEAGRWRPTRIDALATVAIGAFVGLVAGALVSVLLNWRRSFPNLLPDREFVAGSSLAGAMLGWQAGLSVMVLALLVRLVQKGISTAHPSLCVENWPLTGAVLIATLVQLLTWRLQALSITAWWPVVGVSLSAIAVWLLAATMLIAAIRLMDRGNRSTSPADPSRAVHFSEPLGKA